MEQAKKNVEKEYTKYEAVDQYEVMAEELPEEETAEVRQGGAGRTGQGKGRGRAGQGRAGY